MVTILLGNTIVLVPMVLNAHAGTKYGISFPVLCRASFGVRGANVPAMLRAIVACGWFGIQTWIGGAGARRAAAGGVAGLGRACPAAPRIAFVVFWLIQVAVILKGTEGIKLLESWSAPLLLAGGALASRAGPSAPAAGSATCSRESERLRGGNASVLGAVPGGAHRQRRLLGDAEPQHSRLHPLREEPALPDAGPGARPADDDDGVRVHRRGGHERDDRDLRRGDLGSGGAGRPDRRHRR